MHESLFQYAKLLFKLFLDRRAFRGPQEFSFRIMSVGREFHRIRIAARENDFLRTVALRRDTSDLATFEQVFANNDYNLRRLTRWSECNELYHSIAKQGSPLILDIGANIGLAALYFSKNWPAASIVAVEPDANNFDLMCQNVAGVANIHPLKAAIASENGLARITNPSDPAWALRTELVTQRSEHTMAAVSVQHLTDLYPNCRPFIAKIDIEGFESELFSKHTDWVEAFPIIIIELHDWLFPREATSSNFLRTVAERGRDCVFFGENVVSLKN